MGTIANQNAEIVAGAWERKMQVESDEEIRAEQSRDYWSTRAHRVEPSQMMIGFCEMCGHNVNSDIHK